jgi:hypothetical protein
VIKCEKNGQIFACKILDHENASYKKLLITGDFRREPEILTTLTYKYPNCKYVAKMYEELSYIGNGFYFILFYFFKKVNTLS